MCVCVCVRVYVLILYCKYAFIFYSKYGIYVYEWLRVPRVFVYLSIYLRVIMCVLVRVSECVCVLQLEYS